MEVRPLETDREIADAYPLMAQLRPHLEAAEFVSIIRRQAADGYRLVGGFDGRRLVALAGLRVAHTLSRGPHLFVDDLVTDESLRGRGYGKAMIRWLRAYASEQGLPAVHLDSRDSARGFYERAGFTFHTSIPCRIDSGLLDVGIERKDAKTQR
jgi:GNAT superfamily N-acetyltransferase